MSPGIVPPHAAGPLEQTFGEERATGRKLTQISDAVKLEAMLASTADSGVGFE